MNQITFPYNYVNVSCSHLEFPQENSLPRQTSSIATQDKTLFELKPKIPEMINNASRKSQNILLLYRQDKKKVTQEAPIPITQPY